MGLAARRKVAYLKLGRAGLALGHGGARNDRGEEEGEGSDGLHGDGGGSDLGTDKIRSSRGRKVMGFEVRCFGLLLACLCV